MSMHEFEDLVELSIKLLASTGRPIEDLRSRCAALYEFHNEWDTGYTHFRVMELLVAAHYVYKIPFDQYPGQAPGASSEDGWIDLPGQEELVLCEGGLLYIDAGSPAWTGLVQADRLEGVDAQPPRAIDRYELALDICRLAEEKNDRPLIGMWYRLLAADLLNQPDPEAVPKQPALLELRSLVKRTDAMAIEMDYGCLAGPSAEDLEDVPLLAWWFKL